MKFKKKKIKEISDFLIEKRNKEVLTICGFLKKLGLFLGEEPAPLERWANFFEVVADTSWLRVSLQEAIFEPVGGEPDQSRIVGYREVAAFEPGADVIGTEK